MWGVYKDYTPQRSTTRGWWLADTLPTIAPIVWSDQPTFDNITNRDTSLIFLRLYTTRRAQCQKNKIQCCSVDVGVGLLLELLKLLMSQEQDSMLFCLMLVKDWGGS